MLIETGSSHESFVFHRAYDESLGIQSTIEVGEFNNIPAIKKVAGQELGEKTQKILISSTQRYRELLRSVGVSLPNNFLLQLNGGIETIDQFIEGKNLSEEIDAGEYYGFVQLVSLLCELNDGDKFSKVPLDAKLPNWIRNDHGLFFVDLFPPPLRDRKGFIHPWVPELYKRSRRLFTFNYGDTRGQITKLMSGLRITAPLHHYTMTA